MPGDEESDFTKKRRRNWAKLIAKVYFDDPQLCASSGERMKIVAATLRSRTACAPPGQASAATASRFPPPPARSSLLSSRLTLASSG